MSFKTTYQAAQTVSAAIEKHFSNLIETASKRGEQDLAPEPSKEVVETIIDVAFWASLRREEGNSPKVSLAYLPPEKAGQPLVFENRIPLTSHILTKLAPAVERSGIHLGVWKENDELYIWGSTRSIPNCCFVLEVIEPGLLVIKHRRTSGFGKFINVVVLKGDQIKMVDENNMRLSDSPKLLTSLLGFNSPPGLNDSVNVLVQLAASMRAHGHGGSLLVVPSGNEVWRESIVHPVSYPILPVFSNLSDLMNERIGERSPLTWIESVNRTVDSVAGLTAVDGATVINDKLEVLAFGVKIARSAKSEPVEEILIIEPVVDGTAVVTHPAKNGGTRHLSAAQFVSDQRDAIALVASQDGQFTIFSWSKTDQIVHAHHVDTLLM